jgi:small subunit ribosomal protein S6
MRRYETIIITDPDLSAEQRDPVLQRVADVVSQGDGYLALSDEWGARKLAYQIKKKDRGYYIRFDFCGTGAVVNEMERFFRIDDRVMKYMTVLIDKTADIEKIKEEIAAAQNETEKAEEQAMAATASMPTEEPTETQAEAAEEPTTSERPAEAQTESAEIAPSQEPAETEKVQIPQPDAGESEDAPADTEEEKK